MKYNTLFPTTTLRRMLAAAVLIAGFSYAHAQPEVIDSERLSPGDVPVLDGWTIRDRNNNRSKITVQDMGLHYQVVGGKWVDGGRRSILLKGAPGTAIENMNDFAELPLEAPEPGTHYFSAVFNVMELGTNDNPAELFIRILGWDAYFAVKLYGNTVEIPGASAQIIPTEGGVLPPEPDRLALVGINHLLVGKIVTDNLGGIRRISLWLNPSAFDEDTPLVTAVRDGTKNVANIVKLEARSQKVRTLIDTLTFGSTWEEVVPPIPADPGNITLTLPADNDTGTPGIQMTGGTLNVTVGGLEYVAGTILPSGTVVTYEAIPNLEYELMGWNGTVLTGTPISLPVYAVTNISPVFETGEFRVVGAETGNTNFRVELFTDRYRTTTRRLFDNGEQIRVTALSTRSFAFNSWVGELSALNGTGPDGTTPNQVELVVGTGVIWDDKVLNLEGISYINVVQWISSDASDSIEGTEVEFEGAQSGMQYTVPLAEFNRVLAEKAPLGLGGVLNLDNVVGNGPILLEVTPDKSTPAITASIVYNEDGTVASSVRPLTDAFHLLIPGRETPLPIGRGEQFWVENPGRDPNLATAEGPGPFSPNEALWINGEPEYFMDFSTSTSRDHTSGLFGLGGGTSFDLTFDPADKVIMAGGVYLSTNNFQHYNPDDLERLWAQAIYSDGTASPVQSSTQIDQNAGDASFDHFFGFSAPAGAYITNLRIWMRGGNNRAFTQMDDIAVILEGTGDGNYAVATAVSPEGAGAVVPSAEGPYAEGSTVTLTAVENSGYRFLGWAHTADTSRMITDASSLDVLVRTSGDITALFEMIPTSENLEALIGGMVLDLGDGLYESDWLGLLYASEADLPWIYVFGQGWLYIDASGWMYDLAMGWAYTDEEMYPWTYYNDEPYMKWLYFVPGNSDPRRFYDPSSGLLVEVPLSGAQ